MNKPLLIIGIILTVIGGIGMIYIVESAIALLFGITFIIIAVTIDVGGSHKKAVPKEEGIEFCPNCGSAIKKNSRVCAYCGEKL
ncbi:MAG TPA: zinc ribbon domain-containing protein [Candidatus Deferrimicrobium sp.]|nr:zinc ribbon domain-containing protein [Candidatus Deferrimicrobium sp.]